jgi:hypothetical protein
LVFDAEGDMMGKATELDDRRSARYLSAAEITARQRAIELGDDDVQPDLKGQMVKQSSSSEASRLVQQLPAGGWD